MLLINDRKPRGHANIRFYIDRKGGVAPLVCVVLMGGVLCFLLLFSSSAHPRIHLYWR